MLIPEWATLVLSISTAGLLALNLDISHRIRRDLARQRRQQEAPMIKAQDRPRVELVS